MIDERPDDFDIHEYRQDVEQWTTWMLQSHFSSIPLDNHTFEGRVRAELERLLKEATHLDIPTPRSKWATIAYLVGAGSLDSIPTFNGGSLRLYVLLRGGGLTKPRHRLRLADMTLECIEDIELQKPGDPTPEAILLIQELRSLAKGLFHGRLDLPQDKSNWPQLTREIHRMDDKPRVTDSIPGLNQKLRNLFTALIELNRPRVTMIKRTQWPEWIR